jgi:putative ABC transport system permease protein
MDKLLQDIRFGIRMLAKSPVASTTAVIALALGISVCTVMYSIVYGCLLRGLPVEGGDRIMYAQETNVSRNVERASVPLHDYLDWRAQQESFEQLGAYYFGTVNISGKDRPERFNGAFVTANTLDILGVRPLMGRLFLEGEDHPAAEPVVVLGFSVWRDRYDSDPEILGETIRANGMRATVVGVMPEGFEFPGFQKLWLPIRMDPLQLGRREGTGLTVFGRLHQDVSLEEAQAELASIAARLESEHPQVNAGIGARIEPFAYQFLGSGEGVFGLWLMQGAVFLVLLIASANVANLLLSQAFDRGREVAIRTALGASRRRIISQVLTEVGILALCGGALGLALAYIGLELFHASVVDNPPPFFMVITIDRPILQFVIGVVLTTTLLAGVFPAWQASGGNLHKILADESRGSSSFRLGRVSKGLVVVQIAFSCALLMGTGLMIKSIMNLDRADYGFDPDAIFTAGVSLFETDYPSTESRRQFFMELHRELSSLPGVSAATLAQALPVQRVRMSTIAIQGESYPTEADYPRARVTAVMPGYFRTFDAEVLEGRDFMDADDPSGLLVTIVNLSFVDRFFPGQNPLGRRVRLASQGREPTWMTIVGVVPDLYMGGYLNEEPAGMYTPLSQGDARGVNIALRSEEPPLALAAMVRDEVMALDPDLPVYAIGTARAGIKDQTWMYWVFGGLYAILGFVALFLAAVGLYGVMSFATRRRTPEVGIRMALGARGGDVVWLILRQGLTQVVLGLGLGVGLAMWLSFMMAGMLYETEPFDPAIFLLIIATLAGTALCACLLPARRASSVDPLEALRSR